MRVPAFGTRQGCRLSDGGFVPPRSMSLEVPGFRAPPAVLDGEMLASLRELDPDGRHGVVNRVLAAYETMLNRLLAQLRTETAATDPTVVAGIAHTLKSSSASVGARTLSASCADIERRLRAGATGDLHADVQRLLAEGEAALRAVAAVLRPG